MVRVGKLPAPGETVTGGTFAQYQGGKGANQAVAAARLGAQTELVGAIGVDGFGDLARETLHRAGVGVESLRALEGASTGVALIIVDENGANQIAVASGANALVDAAAVRESFATGSLAQAGGVYLSNFEVADDAVIAGAQAAAESGMLMVINPAPARELPQSLVALQPILVPNEIEALALTGEVEPVAAARVLAARTGAPVVVTLGAQGAMVIQSSEVERVPAPLIDAVDTTGAGDAFAGALAAELSIGRSLLEAVNFAVHAASLSTRVAGAREGMPARDDVDRALRGEL